MINALKLNSATGACAFVINNSTNIEFIITTLLFGQYFMNPFLAVRAFIFPAADSNDKLMQIEIIELSNKKGGNL